MKFEDGDREEYTYGEILLYRKSKQVYSRKKKIKPTMCGPKCHFSNAAFFIPTKANPNPVKKDYLTKHRAFLMNQQHKEYCEKAHSALAGAVLDDELKKLASYKELVNHSNSVIRDRWTKGGENEFGRLFQGFAPNEVEGLNVLEWIRKDQVSKDKFATYPR